MNVVWKRIGRYGIAFLFLFVLYRVFAENIHQLERVKLSLDAENVVVAYLLAFVYFGLNAYSWHRVTNLFGIAIPFREAMRAWFLSQLGKYVPGKIWVVVGRVQAYAAKGKSRGFVIAGVLVELCLRSLAGVILLIAYWGSRSNANASGTLVFYVIALGVGIALFLQPTVFRKVLALVRQLMKQEACDVTFRTRDLIGILALELAAWLVGGTGMFVLAATYGQEPFLAILMYSASLAAAGVLGLLAIFVPSGLGVREGVFVFLVQDAIPVALAVVYSLMARVWMTTAELVAVSVVVLWVRFGRGTSG